MRNVPPPPKDRTPTEAERHAAESFAQFGAAHQRGIAALERGDLAGFEQAIDEERAAIEKHRVAVELQRRELERASTLESHHEKKND